MASAFAHAFSAYAIGKVGFSKKQSIKFWLLGMFCAVMPDFDVLSFKLGIPYEHMLGHRGLSHSLAFALFTGLVVTFIFYRNYKAGSWPWFKSTLYFTICTASHGLLDAMTTGGKGVAFFAPFENSRYFLPFRPIRVSPIHIEDFFGEWGRRVLLSELYWVGIPCLGLIVGVWLLRKILN